MKKVIFLALQFLFKLRLGASLGRSVVGRSVGRSVGWSSTQNFVLEHSRIFRKAKPNLPDVASAAVLGFTHAQM